MHLKTVFPMQTWRHRQLKIVFPSNSQQWLPERREFRDFVRKCWNAETHETREIFNAGDRIMFSMFRLFLSSPLLGERYVNCVSTHATEKKSHVS